MRDVLHGFPEVGFRIRAGMEQWLKRMGAVHIGVVLRATRIGWGCCYNWAGSRPQFRTTPDPEPAYRNCESAPSAPTNSTASWNASGTRWNPSDAVSALKRWAAGRQKNVTEELANQCHEFNV